jgi:hypothetical protein
VNAADAATDGNGPETASCSPTEPQETGPVLTAEEAATIASAHGLSLQDAASLRVLADDPAEADRIAASFATDQTGRRPPQETTTR